MSRRIIHASGIVIMGMVLMVSQGCSLKALQSNGDSLADTKAGSSARSDVNNWNGEGVNPDFPQNFSGLGQGNSSGELSGFPLNPTEERLTQGGYKASLSPSDVNVRRRAELTKEEKAAIDAGFQDVFYGYDQWHVSDAGMEALNRDASWLKDHPGAVVWLDLGMLIYWFYGRVHSPLGNQAERAARTSAQSLANLVTVTGALGIFNGFFMTVLGYMTEFGITTEATAKWHEIHVTPEQADAVGLGVLGLGIAILLVGVVALRRATGERGWRTA